MIRIPDRSAVLMCLALVVGPTCWAVPILQQAASIALPGVNGHIDHLTADLEGNRLFVSALGNGSVEVVDVAASKAAHRLAGFCEPQGVLFIAGAAQLMVTDAQADHATIVDAAKLTPVGTVALPEDSDNLRIDSDGNVWVGAGSRRGSPLLMIDPVGGKTVKQIKLRGHPESFQLEQRGPRIFVNVPTAHVVQVLDRQRGTVIADWDVPAATTARCRRRRTTPNGNSLSLQPVE